jgi:hypothetical protein
MKLLHNEISCLSLNIGGNGRTVTYSDDGISFPVSSKLSFSLLVPFVDPWIPLVSFFNHPSLLELILPICLLFDSVPILLSLTPEVLLDEGRIVFIHKRIHSIL